VLGDIAQRTAEARLSTWERVLGDAGVERMAIAELLVSYRVPDDFLQVAAMLHPEANVPEGVRRAPWPAVSVATVAPGESALALAERMEAEVVGSVGVIVPAALHDAVAAAFGGRARDVEESLSAGVNIVDLAAIKGLEFDAVVVVERSTRALAVVHAEPLPEDLAAAEDLRAVAGADGWAAGAR
jgi:DNA helicase IV